MKAGTECVSYKVKDDGTTLPRSIKTYLEDKLLKLCLKAEEEQNIDISTILSTKIDHNFSYADFSFLDSEKTRKESIAINNNIILPGFVFEGSKLPLGLDGLKQVNQDNHLSFKTNENMSLITTISHIPLNVSKDLLEIFEKRINKFFPILSENEANDSLNSIVKGNGTKYDTIVIALVYCLTATTATREFKKKSLEFHMNLYQRVLKEFNSLNSPNDLNTLKILLLMMVYTQMNPGLTNLEFLLGICYRMIINLGLHKLIPNNLISNEEQISRACLLYTFLDSDIGTNVCQWKSNFLPLKNVEFKISDFPIDDVNFKLKMMNSFIIWQFRSLEEEVYNLHFNNENNKLNIEDLIISLDLKIHKWYSEVLNLNNKEFNLDMDIKHWSKIGIHILMIYLHKPSQKNKKPSISSVIRLFKNAYELAQSIEIQQSLNYGSVKYSWLSVHHLYVAALCYVYSIKRLIMENFKLDLNEVEKNVEQISKSFNILSEVWIKAGSCTIVFHKLIDPILHSLNANQNQNLIHLEQDKSSDIPISNSELWNFIDDEFKLMFESNDSNEFTQSNQVFNEETEPQFQWGDTDFNEFSEMFI